MHLCSLVYKVGHEAELQVLNRPVCRRAYRLERSPLQYLVLYFSNLHDIKRNFMKTFQWKISTYLVLLFLYAAYTWREVRRWKNLDSEYAARTRQREVSITKTMSQVTAHIVPEASGNPPKLPKFPQDTRNGCVVQVGRKSPDC